MPIPIIGDIISAVSTAKQNKKSQEFARERYQVEKKDSLDFWRQQNEYNTPEAQMARFQKAGLNPNLIYGQGSSGNAGQIDTPDTQSASFRTPDLGGLKSSSPLLDYFDVRIKQATTSNLKAQNGVLQQEMILKAVERLNKLKDLGMKNTQHARDKLNLMGEALLHRYDADAAQEWKRKQLHAVKTDVEQLKQLKSTTKIKKLEEDLAKVGIFKGSNIFNTVMSMLAKQVNK